MPSCPPWFGGSGPLRHGGFPLKRIRLSTCSPTLPPSPASRDRNTSTLPRAFLVGARAEIEKYHTHTLPVERHGEPGAISGFASTVPSATLVRSLLARPLAPSRLFNPARNLAPNQCRSTSPTFDQLEGTLLRCAQESRWFAPSLAASAGSVLTTSPHSPPIDRTTSDHRLVHSRRRLQRPATGSSCL